MTQILGSSYPTTIATLSDEATIIDAFKYYHQGGLTNSPAPNSIEGHLISVNSRVDTINTQLGYSGISPAPSSVHTRLASLESVVGTSLASTYIKATPSSNDTPSTRNLITPTLSGIIPLTIQGVLGQTADLQQWKTSAATVARIDNIGKFYSYDGSSTAEVATVSGTQTLTNKTLTNPIQTIGTNSRISSYTLTLADQSKVIEVNSASSAIISVPPDSAVNFPIGTYIVVLQTGIGQVSIGAIIGTEGTATINATPGLKLRTQWSMATLIKRGTNLWVAAGDLSS